MGASIRLASLMLLLLLLSSMCTQCGPKGTEPVIELGYPVASQYDVDPKAWCIGYLGYPEVPLETCQFYFSESAVTDLYYHYNTPGQIFRYCFLDSNGVYQPKVQKPECLDIRGLEDKAKPYGVRAK